MLSNKTILITRPAGREKHLRQLIEQAGGTVVHYPAIAIQSPTELEIEQLKQIRKQLHTFTLAIFISPTAVEQSQVYFPDLPENLTVVSIGSKTTQALEQINIRVDNEAQDHNSESLLSSTEFQATQLQGQRILIFRGQGGRALLGETLISRGAELCYVETYKRIIPDQLPLSEQQIRTLDALTVSSNEGLQNLIILLKNSNLLGGPDRLPRLPPRLLPGLLGNIPLVVPSKRTAELARQHGFKIIISAQNATDSATLDALLDHFS